MSDNQSKVNDTLIVRHVQVRDTIIVREEKSILTKRVKRKKNKVLPCCRCLVSDSCMKCAITHRN